MSVRDRGFLALPAIARNMGGMARFHMPNPLDALFLAIDEAWRRCGLWSADIHIYLETGGEVDVAGLRRAMRALHRLYPATAGRLTRRLLARAPAWRLDVPPPDVEQVVRMEMLDPEGNGLQRAAGAPGNDGLWAKPATVAATGPANRALQRRLDALLAEPLNLDAGPPLRVWVLRRPGQGDFVVLRWPHALMDARGGEFIIRQLDRLFREQTDPETLESVGDELRRDFGTLDPNPSLFRCWGALRERGGTSLRDWRDIRLDDARTIRGDERQRGFVRRFDEAGLSEIRATATRVCGFARVGDFLRACAIRAMHDLARARGLSGSGYSTLHLVENRRRRDPTPVCHNIFTTTPIRIPADMAADRRAVADRVQQAAAALLEPGVMQRRLAGLALLARLGTRAIAREIERGLRTGRSRLPMGLVQSPSLPMGFMNLFTKPLRSFCGPPLENLYGLRAASPLAGLGINICTFNGRLNISGVFVEPHVSRATIDELLDRFAGYLHDPRV